jgi:hypothetical protein
MNEEQVDVDDEREWDPKKPSRGVIACGNDAGCVLYYVGAALANQFEDGLCQLDDLGLDDAPEGISIWEGRGRWNRGPWDCPDDGDYELVGKFRPPTADEWAAIQRGECPWPAADWQRSLSEEQSLNKAQSLSEALRSGGSER